MTTFREWAIQQHRNTNHFYDKIIPYEYHLNMVVKEVIRHLGNKPDYVGFSPFISRNIFIDAAYGHDLIEDTRVTYNDILQAGASNEAAEIIFAVTDEKGKTRAERGSKAHYEKLVKVPGAAFIKFCDRIANVKYSKFSESSMFEKYKKEHLEFIEKCYIPELKPYGLVETLINSFE